MSVTQQFNTSTSMGRLTLNVLLSFAQFDWEVAGERIRDKFAASRRKGMWMGGTVPLGYRVKDRKLAVDAAEADIRHLREVAEEKERIRQEAADRLRRRQERKERIAKREAFTEQKAKDYARLTQLKAFNEYLAGQSQDPNADAVATIGRVAQELVDRLTHALSVSELNQEIDRRGLYTADDA